LKRLEVVCPDFEQIRIVSGLVFDAGRPRVVRGVGLLTIAAALRLCRPVPGGFR